MNVNVASGPIETAYSRLEKHVPGENSSVPQRTAGRKSEKKVGSFGFLRGTGKGEKKMSRKRVWKMGMAVLPVAAAAYVLAGCGNQGNTGSDQGKSEASGAQENSDGASQTEDAGEGDQLAKILEAGKIVIGTEGTYSPNSYHDESGELVGFDVEVARKVAEKLGVEAEFMEAEWDSLFAAMDSGRIDTVINEVEYSDERALKYDFSQPYTYIHGAIMVKGDNEEIDSFEDLDGKKAAQNLTSSWGTMAEEYGAELVGVDAVSQCVDLLLSGRADATLNVETAFADYLKNHPDADVKIVARTEEVSSSLIPVKKGNEDLLKAVNDALDELRQSGELAELSEKYFGMDVTSE